MNHTVFWSFVRMNFIAKMELQYCGGVISQWTEADVTGTGILPPSIIEREFKMAKSLTGHVSFGRAVPQKSADPRLPA
jgi:hypothetical protein